MTAALFDCCGAWTFVEIPQRKLSGPRPWLVA